MDGIVVENGYGNRSEDMGEVKINGVGENDGLNEDDELNEDWRLFI